MNDCYGRTLGIYDRVLGPGMRTGMVAGTGVLRGELVMYVRWDGRRPGAPDDARIADWYDTVRAVDLVKVGDE